jgi:hypothetical protein
MRFTYNNTEFVVVASRGKVFDHHHTVKKLDKEKQWPGENGKFPPGSFLEAIHDGPIEFGEFDKKNADGTREYFICQEISFL